MKKMIYQLLNMTPTEYENVFFNSYFEWCESVSINVRETQLIISNNPIARWYQMEYEKCEREFLKKAAGYENNQLITIDDHRLCFYDCTFRMMSLSPKPLLKIAKKAEGTFQLPVPGIKIFNYN